MRDSRDRSRLAEHAFALPVPAAVVEAIADHPEIPVHRTWRAAGSRREGSWGELFGGTVEGDEAFMAQAYAEFVQAVTDAGRRDYDLPCFANAWLDIYVDAPAEDISAVAGGKTPGEYPSGGPVPRVGPIWNAIAPSLDLLAPDIYYGDFDRLCRIFRDGSGGRLLIPEMNVSKAGIAQLIYAVGEYQAIGVAPFAVDRVAPGEPLWDELHDAYRMLRAAGAAWAAQPNAGSRGFMLTETNPTAELVLGSFTIKIDGSFSPDQADDYAFGLLIQEAPDTILAMGRGFTASFGSTDGTRIGMLTATELQDGAGAITRILNGDETVQGTVGRFPSLKEQHAGVPVLGVAGSRGIVRFTFYHPVVADDGASG